jgi:TnpA family transposase
MPVTFLTALQRASYGRYVGVPSSEELSQYFHLDDADRASISQKRGAHSRLGFALQLTTVRFLGTFLEDPTAVPATVVQFVAKQINISDIEVLSAYRDSEQRWIHTMEIRTQYGYKEFVDPIAGFRLTRWIYTLCWTGTERPSVLFERATTWLLTHRLLLPGVSVLERFVSKVRARVEFRLWRFLGQEVNLEQRKRLESLLIVPEGSRVSLLDRLRSGPFRISATALSRAIQRLQRIREVGITPPQTARIPQSRIASLARFAATAKVTVIARLPQARRIATLVAFAYCMEATANDDALALLEIVLHDLFSAAQRTDKKTRLRTIKDLDRAASILADACRILIESALPDDELRSKIFKQVPRPVLTQALDEVAALVRPPDDVYYRELQEQYRSVRRFLPTLVKHIRFGASPAGMPVVAGLDWLRENPNGGKSKKNDAPREVIVKSWQRYVGREDGGFDFRAYTFCVLDQLRTALQRRDVFVCPSWRYGDPRVGLLTGAEWEATRPVICRSLEVPPDPKPALSALTEELDQTFHAVTARLPRNPSVRFETVNGKRDLVLSPLEKLEEPDSLVALRKAVAPRLPRIDLPEIFLEISARTGFPEAFTHITEHSARAVDLDVSICAVLLGEACNTGMEPLVHHDTPALRRDRMSWVKQNYFRDDGIIGAGAKLVAAQNRIPLARAWGGGEVASADGMRFVVPVRTIHAGPNPKYFGHGRGVTWYNLISDQFSGLNAITVPGTLRDSMVLLAVVLEQQTELQPTQIMTDTGAYSDVVFGLFRLLGYRFSPRLADIGGTRLWRIDPHADYGDLNDMSRHKINLQLIAAHWDDLLRLAGSLKLGRVPAAGIMRMLQIGDRPTRLAQALAEFGRIEKTLHILTYIDDERRRRSTLLQLNRGEGRHSLGRTIFHGKRGELRQRYREGQEDQLGALGLAVNIVVLWNTIYMNAVLAQLRREGYPVRDEDVARLSPLIYDHINVLGRYSFAIPEAVTRGELRPLRDPREENP